MDWYDHLNGMGKSFRRRTKAAYLWIASAHNAVTHKGAEKDTGYLSERVKTCKNMPRIIWLILPAGRTAEQEIGHLGNLLKPEDIVIEDHYILRDNISEGPNDDGRFKLSMSDTYTVCWHGSVISSWLLDLGDTSLVKDRKLKEFSTLVQISSRSIEPSALCARHPEQWELTFGERIFAAISSAVGIYNEAQ